jgi:dGTPase
MDLYPEITVKIIERSHKREEMLSERASKDIDFKRRKKREPESHIRQAFYRDSDRILHSMAYSRYVDKTQVFYLVNNDHVTHRVLHVQLVSKIARTIGRSLGLNEDLIEAISLGHDIGHVPYGHFGEETLRDCCKKYGIGKFSHNVQAIRFLDLIEDKNLTLQVMDGILCHNGEVPVEPIKPEGELNWDSFDTKLDRIKSGEDVKPLTYEGCVVRFADNIAYLGRDLQDALEIKLISKAVFSANYGKICKNILDLSNRKNINRTIIDTLTKDVINNSYGKDEISFSDKIADCVNQLKNSNYKFIYLNPALHIEDNKIKKMYQFMFDRFIHDLEVNHKKSLIFKDMFKPHWISKRYLKSVDRPELVMDYLAGMTDRYFNRVFQNLVIPEEIIIDYTNRIGVSGRGG